MNASRDGKATCPTRINQALRNRWQVPICAGVFLLIACGDKPDPRVDAREQPERAVRTSMFGTVLPLRAGRTTLQQCGRRTPSLVTKFWSPSRAVIAELEERLPSVVATLNTSEVRLAGTDSMFYRQYIGLVRWNGKRTVYVNAIDRKYVGSLNRMRKQVGKDPFSPAGDTVTWRVTPMTVCDGGARFWGVEYDPDKKSFEAPRVNRTAG
jgi:hypothetical protein